MCLIFGSLVPNGLLLSVCLTWEVKDVSHVKEQGESVQGHVPRPAGDQENGAFEESRSACLHSRVRSEQGKANRVTSVNSGWSRWVTEGAIY